MILLKNIITYTILLIAISSICFFLLPKGLDIMPFSGKLFYGELELWRIITFPFIHINLGHLIQNIIAISIITFFAFEVGLSNFYYLGAFFGSSLIISLITGIVVPTMVIAGLSMGIYSIIGSTSIRGSNFIPKKVLIPLFTAAIFIEPTIARFEPTIMKSAIFHFLGFVFGITFIYSAKWLIPKKRILTAGD